MNDDIPVSVITSTEDMRVAGLTQRQRRIRRYIVAVHEASHAVVAMAYGIEFHHVQVIDEYNGEVSGGLEESYRKRPRDWCFCGAAGLAGELFVLRRHGEQQLEEGAHEGAAMDTANLRALAPCTGLSIPEIRGHAHQLVVANWPHIDALARRLLSRPTMARGAATAAAGPVTEQFQQLPGSRRPRWDNALPNAARR